MPTRTVARSLAALVVVGTFATPIAVAVAPSAHPAAAIPAASIFIPDDVNPPANPAGDPPATSALAGMVPVPDYVNPAG
jgi:hypothetical protein